MFGDPYRGPYTRIELCVFSISDQELSCLLLKRDEFPESGKWALPGGPLLTLDDKDLTDAARRVCLDRLRTKPQTVKIHGAVGGGQRDLRASWSLSIFYRTLIPVEYFQPGPLMKASDFMWLAASQLDSKVEIAFDHREIIRGFDTARQNVASEMSGKAFWMLLQPLPPLLR